MKKKIDLTFQVGDQVRTTTYPNKNGVILKIHTNGADVRINIGPRYNNYEEIYYNFNELQFSCHHSDALFLSTELDKDEAYKDGYNSGLAIGLVNKPYKAGGPYVSRDREGCRHWKQHSEFEVANNKAWRKGWAAGQERAFMKKPLNFAKPLRTVGDHRPVHYIGRVSPDSKDYMINVGAGDPPKFNDRIVERIDKHGSFGHGKYEIVIENVPERATFGEVLRTANGHVVSLNITFEGDEIISVEWVK